VGPPRCSHYKEQFQSAAAGGGDRSWFKAMEGQGRSSKDGGGVKEGGGED